MFNNFRQYKHRVDSVTEFNTGNHWDQKLCTP